MSYLLPCGCFFGIQLVESADMPNQVMWSRQIIIKIMIAIIEMIKRTVYIRTVTGTNICLLTRFLSSHVANQQNSNKSRKRNNPQNTNTKTRGNQQVRRIISRKLGDSSNELPIRKKTSVGGNSVCKCACAICAICTICARNEKNNKPACLVHQAHRLLDKSGHQAEQFWLKCWEGRVIGHDFFKLILGMFVGTMRHQGPKILRSIFWLHITTHKSQTKYTTKCPVGTSNSSWAIAVYRDPKQPETNQSMAKLTYIWNLDPKMWVYPTYQHMNLDTLIRPNDH